MALRELFLHICIFLCITHKIRSQQRCQILARDMDDKWGTKSGKNGNQIRNSVFHLMVYSCRFFMICNVSNNEKKIFLLKSYTLMEIFYWQT